MRDIKGLPKMFSGSKILSLFLYIKSMKMCFKQEIIFAINFSYIDFATT